MIADGHSNSPAKGLLLLDIGNTRIGVASWQEGKVGESAHVPAEPADQLTETLRRLWNSLPEDDARSAVASSVQPDYLAAVEAAAVRAGIEPLLLIGRDLELPIDADVPEPAKVGTDRLCSAAAAYMRVKSACVVADFGTALTVDLVADNGVFLGGTILPGVAMAARALHEQTALLPLVEVGTPSERLGKDTISAIRTGIYAGMIGALREITEGYATQLGKWPPLVLTGGDARSIGPGCDFADAVMPDLCFEGIALAYERSFEEEE